MITLDSISESPYVLPACPPLLVHTNLHLWAGFGSNRRVLRTVDFISYSRRIHYSRRRKNIAGYDKINDKDL